MPHRYIHAEREILRLLRSHPTRCLSYDSMAASITTLDRRSLITAMKRLERKQQVVILRGKGSTPNQYELQVSNGNR